MNKVITLLAALLTASVLLNIELLTADRSTKIDNSIPIDQSSVTACHTPKQDCAPLIVAAIDSAREELLVQAYGFTNESILRAIARAKGRGVDVRIILDKSNEQKRYSGGTCMAEAGIPILIDHKVAIAHNKVMIIDGANVVTGSFNFTESADEKNAENVLYVRNNRELAADYKEDWMHRLSVSRPFKKPDNKCSL